jgi:hypothetical protein
MRPGIDRNWRNQNPGHQRASPTLLNEHLQKIGFKKTSIGLLFSCTIDKGIAQDNRLQAMKIPN